MKGILLVNATKNMTIGSEKMIGENAKTYFPDWALIIVRSDLDYTTAEFIEATHEASPDCVTVEFSQPVAVEMPKVGTESRARKKPRGPYKPRKSKTELK